jgi:hypothetical protein
MRIESLMVSPGFASSRSIHRPRPGHSSEPISVATHKVCSLRRVPGFQHEPERSAQRLRRSVHEEGLPPFNTVLTAPLELLVPVAKDNHYPPE